LWRFAELLNPSSLIDPRKNGYTKAFEMALNMIMVVDDDEFQLSLMNEQLLALGGPMCWWPPAVRQHCGSIPFGPNIAVIIGDLSCPAWMVWC
jgi:hypothetical protein